MNPVNSDPFALFDQLTAARAAMDEKEVRTEGGMVDPVRAQRDAERRERLGQLRAREHPGKRPRDKMKGRVFG